MPVAQTTVNRSRVDLGRAGVGPRLARGDQGELLDAVERACLDPVEHLGRVDGYRCGEPHR